MAWGSDIEELTDALIYHKSIRIPILHEMTVMAPNLREDNDTAMRVCLRTPLSDPRKKEHRPVYPLLEAWGFPSY